MTEINIEAAPQNAIPIKLVGKTYEIVPPKAALAMRLAVESKLYADDPSKMADILDAWIRRAFGERAEKVQKRLDDPEDLLDNMHVMALMEKVIEFQMDEIPTT